MKKKIEMCLSDIGRYFEISVFEISVFEISVVDCLICRLMFENI